VLLEGPMESLAVVMQQLKSDSNLAEIVEHELRSLTKKLPEDLRGADATFDVADADWVKTLVESAYAEIHSRLQSTEASS
jgi:hypothetical protein